MNSVVLVGRLTKDPDVRYSQGNEPMAVARYTLAVDRRGKEQTTDFISCIAFGRNGEFAEKYLHKGMKIAVNGRIQTGSYKNKDGQTVYTTDVVVEGHEFVESKNASTSAPASAPTSNGFDADGFMKLAEIDEDELPFI